jgi:hypothetical protein
MRKTVGFGKTAQRGTWRVSDATGSFRQSPAYKRVHGYTVMELMTVLALTGIILAMAIPNIPRGTYDLWGTQTLFLGDIRAARTLSLTKGDHFRLLVTGVDSYEVRRMQLLGGIWIDRVQPPITARTLPTHISFAAGVTNSYEFNTRGLLVNSNAVQDILLTDSQSGRYRGVTVWPSGQVAPDNDAAPAGP